MSSDSDTRAGRRGGRRRPPKPTKTKATADADPYRGKATRRPVSFAAWYADALAAAALGNLDLPDDGGDLGQHAGFGGVAGPDGAEREAALAAAGHAIDAAFADIDEPIAQFRSDPQARKALLAVFAGRRSKMPAHIAAFYNEGFRILAQRVGEPEPAPAVPQDFVDPHMSLAELAEERGQPKGTGRTPALSLNKNKVRAAQLDRATPNYTRRVGRPSAAMMQQAKEQGVPVEELTRKAATNAEVTAESIRTNLVTHFGEEKATAYLATMDFDPEKLVRKAKEAHQEINAMREERKFRPMDKHALQRVDYFRVEGVLEHLPAAKDAVDAAASSFGGKGLQVLKPQWRQYVKDKHRQPFNYAPPPPPLPLGSRWDAFDLNADASGASTPVSAAPDPPAPPMFVHVDLLNPERPQRPIISYRVADTVVLADFVEKLPCRTEHLHLRPVTLAKTEEGLHVVRDPDEQDEPPQGPQHNIGHCFIFAEGTFFVNDRMPGWEAFVFETADWVDRRLPQNSPMRPLRVAYMSESTFGGLELRLNYPYLLVHGAHHGCQHRIAFTNLTVGPDTHSPLAPASSTPYPDVYPTFVSLNHGINRRSMLMACHGCGSGYARYLVEADPLADTLPAAWCGDCLASLHAGSTEQEVGMMRVQEVHYSGGAKREAEWGGEGGGPGEDPLFDVSLEEFMGDGQGGDFGSPWESGALEGTGWDPARVEDWLADLGTGGGFEMDADVDLGDL
ncbi:hypothetical protein DFJ74DRAFT_747273 [Hyaloraphidium curvatum]|nr:hypothetical protein DFJ74DRAFT_747273 [Hyaloraphidium curvatum]